MSTNVEVRVLDDNDIVKYISIIRPFSKDSIADIKNKIINKEAVYTFIYSWDNDTYEPVFDIVKKLEEKGAKVEIRLIDGVEFEIVTTSQLKKYINRFSEIESDIDYEVEAVAISEFDTFVDLTSFGLGEYKLEEKGEKYLWDITKPIFDAVEIDDYLMVFEAYINLVSEKSWDSTNSGQYVTYNVVFFNEIYIIIPPMWEKADEQNYWNYIYLCKDMNMREDLFGIGISNIQLIEKILELPKEQFSRKELSEKFGKCF